jgi:hypothetical protein
LGFWIADRVSSVFTLIALFWQSEIDRLFYKPEACLAFDTLFRRPEWIGRILPYPFVWIFWLPFTCLCHDDSTALAAQWRSAGIRTGLI